MEASAREDNSFLTMASLLSVYARLFQVHCMLCPRVFCHRSEYIIAGMTIRKYVLCTGQYIKVASNVHMSHHLAALVEEVSYPSKMPLR